MAARLPSAVPGHAAAIRYVQDHRDTIRRIISSRLGARLRRVFSTTDIEQSLLRVLLEKPPRPLADHELDRVVTVIVVRLIAAKARHEHHCRWVVLGPEHELATGSADDQVEQAGAHEFWEAVRAAAGDDWPLVEARSQGRTFKELADSFGVSADALHMRWKRAIDRITKELGGLGYD